MARITQIYLFPGIDPHRIRRSLGEIQNVTGVPRACTHQVDAWTDTVAANPGAFADAITGEPDYPCTAGQLIHNIDILEAMAKSADIGATIPHGERALQRATGKNVGLL